MRAVRFSVRFPVRHFKSFVWATCAFAAAHSSAANTVRIAFIDVLSSPLALAGEGSLKQLREVVLQPNASNPCTPAQMGPWGADKVGVNWNWGHNAPTAELEKIYAGHKQKYNEDFIFAHQLQAPLFLGIWTKQGSKGVKYDAENTGYGFRSEMVSDAYVSSQPTSCQMKLPVA